MAAAGLSRCVIALHHCLRTMCIQITKHTPLSFASWCMLHIHNSASLRGVCADTPLSFASLVYLLHIHNSAAPRLCIFPYTINSSDVRHYYTIPRVMLNYLKATAVLCKRLAKMCYKFDPIYRFLQFFCESFSRF